MIKAVLLLLMLLVACNSADTIPDVSVPDTKEPSCPVCDDGDSCTTDICGPETSYLCVIETVSPCCGDSVCEEGEDCADDCPVCEAGECQTASFDYDTQECVVVDTVPCCGNGVCEEDETHDSCDADCPLCETNGKCMTSVYSMELQKCVVKPIIPCCGNNICDRGESCENCGDCKCYGTTLADFPDFLDDDTLIVVGDKATSQDTFTASNLATNLLVEGVKTESNIYSMFSSSDLEDNDLIVIGRPCENNLWEDFQGIECGTDNYFEKDTALIKLIFEGGREIVYVGGYSPDDTKAAAEELLGGGLKGTEEELNT